jgi:hypothetical protein
LGPPRIVQLNDRPIDTLPASETKPRVIWDLDQFEYANCIIVSNMVMVMIVAMMHGADGG